MSAARGIQLYYQGLAARALGDAERSTNIFLDLRQTGEALLDRSAVGIGFFSSFGERQSQRARLASGHYVAALGLLGMGEDEMAAGRLMQALKASPDHLGAKTALTELGRL